MENKVGSMFEQHQRETMKAITDKLTKMENEAAGTAKYQSVATEQLQREVVNVAESQACVTENQRHLQQDVANMTQSQCRLQKQMATLQSQVSEVIRHQVHFSERKEQSKPFLLSPHLHSP